MTINTQPGPLLRVRNLSKTFPGQRALADVQLDIFAGEIVAVVGQNGSGKSTLVKVLTGIHEPDAGAEITLRRDDGTEVRGHAATSEVHVIHQDLGLIPLLNTVENLALGRGPGRRLILPIRGKAERSRARQLITRFGAAFDVTVPVGSLSPAERAIVAIARALDGWARPDQVLLLDEPTAALQENESERLFTAVRRLAADGAGVVFISHRLGEVLDLATRVVALRGGRVSADVQSPRLDRNALIRIITGRDESRAQVRPTSAPGGEPVLTVRGLTGAGVRSVDLDVRAGEIVGVCGLLGSGRERVCGMIFGAAPREGEVRVHSTVLPPGSPRAAIANGLGFVPSDRQAHGVIMSMRVDENLTLPNLETLRSRIGSLSAAAERREAAHWISRVQLDPPLPQRHLEQLSGGNQQKVVLAKWLRNKPCVLLLDEPTQGVDVGATSAIYDLIRAAVTGGAGVLVSSSDNAELEALCDRVIVLYDGAVTAQLEPPVLTEARLVRESQRPSAPPQPNDAEVQAGATHV
jgi:ABC-type sugar transport system ATPase subunit